MHHSRQNMSTGMNEYEMIRKSIQPEHLCHLHICMRSHHCTEEKRVYKFEFTILMNKNSICVTCISECESTTVPRKNFTNGAGLLQSFRDHFLQHVLLYDTIGTGKNQRSTPSKVCHTSSTNECYVRQRCGSQTNIVTHCNNTIQ